MAAKKKKTVGDEIEAQLLGAIKDAENAPLPGARSLPILRGLTPKDGFVLAQENVLLQGVKLLKESGRVFIYGNSIVFETRRFDSSGARLVPLRTAQTVEVGAEDLVANIILCRCGERQFPVPKWFVDLLLRSELLLDHIPQIQHYATRPVFDVDFVLRGPGWHPEVNILVHGPVVEPIEFTPGDPDDPAIERLPHHLWTLLAGFCFRSGADLINAVAVLLTGLLMNHFVTDGKPLVMLDGNQPGVGKTLLVRSIGVVVDGVDPRLIHFTPDDEELAKRLCSLLREGNQSIVLIDNAKVVSGTSVSSPCIEANSMAPEVSLRILGKSENYSRPNDLLWAITMNDTRTDGDIVTRGLPVRLAHEGRPEDRTFDGPDPIKYARDHRLDILGELAGMVVNWNQQGRPPGSRSHRLGPWSEVIGGVLEAARLPEFLENAQEAAASFNSDLDELAALAEAVIAAALAGDDEEA